MRSGGWHRERTTAVHVHRGSRKHVRRLKWHKHTTVHFWVMLALFALLLFGFIPWMWRHSAHVSIPRAHLEERHDP
jgi:hypothetical protein